MKMLFIISASIAIKKCNVILKALSNQQIFINCIVTNNAKKMTNLEDLKKSIKGKIYSDSSEKNNKMFHIKLTRKTDLIVVCPATANIIAKYANGFADDLASTSLIASNKQIIFIPAMNAEMWNNSINQKNVSKLMDMGVEFIGPEYGHLSCDEVGLGRLSNAKKIQGILIQNLNRSQIFKNKKCLITAGPTLEPIDPIRYISNHSSGKQGYEVAKQMILSGAKVTLVSGPTNIQAPYQAKLIKVKTAKEMFTAAKKHSEVDIAIFTAAVSDASPRKLFNYKIKKENLKNIILKKNRDILQNISSLKKNRPNIVIGFAAETTNHINNAKKKLQSKKCDAIIVNKIDNNKIFGSDHNKVSFIKNNYVKNLKKMSKANVAKELIQFISQLKTN